MRSFGVLLFQNSFPYKASVNVLLCPSYLPRKEPSTMCDFVVKIHELLGGKFIKRRNLLALCIFRSAHSVSPALLFHASMAFSAETYPFEQTPQPLQVHQK
jgi:hypothetical protein